MKNTVLVLSMIPFFVLADNVSDQRMQELQCALAGKKAELSYLEAQIAAKEELIDVILERGGELYYEIYAELNQEDKKSFKEEVDLFEYAVDEAIYCVDEMKKLFMKKISCENESNKKKFDRIKFVLIRQAVEYCSLRELLKCYIKSLDDLQILKLEIKKLQ